MTAGRTRALRNTVRNTLRPGYARVMFAKLWGRRRGAARERAEALAWATQGRRAPGELCREIDAALWAEAREVGEGIRARAAELRSRTGEPVGGGARFELLYFLTRVSRPEVVVETGVAAGYSSAAFLAALARNASGHLYSSDFPYFRAKNPEQQVGVLVPEEIRDRWTLLVAGDRANLPEILGRVDRVHLFHYDSDKSYEGRRFGMEIVEPRLAEDAIVVMDDIQDNLYFRDYVRSRGLPYMLLGHRNAAVGALGLERLQRR